MVLAKLQYENTTNAIPQSYIREDFKHYNMKLQEEQRSTKLLKRIPLERLMDLKIDYAFKQFFGNERNKEMTVVFLNAIFQKAGRNPIKDITFLNTESGREYMDDKLSKLGFLVTTDADERINVEFQFTDKYNMIKRSLVYWAGVYRSPMGKNGSHSELRPVISINFLNFDIIEQTDRFHTTYHLFEDEEQFRLTDMLEFHFIEMSKLIKEWKEEKLDPWNDVLARWLLLLGMIDSRKSKIYDDIYNELEAIAMKDETLRRAFQSWEELSMTPEQYLAYESRLQHILDEEANQREKELFEEEKKALDERKKALGQEKEALDERKKILAEELEALSEEKRALKEKEEQLFQMEESIKRWAMEVAEERKDVKEKLKEETKRAEKEAIALRLLEMGLEVKFAAESTGLTEDRVIEIQRGTIEK